MGDILFNLIAPPSRVVRVEMDGSKLVESRDYYSSNGTQIAAATTAEKAHGKLYFGSVSRP